MTRVEVRHVYSLPTDLRWEVNQLIEQCAAETGATVVGAPTVYFDGSFTTLEVNPHPWWEQHMAVHYRRLTQLAVNRLMQPADKSRTG